MSDYLLKQLRKIQCCDPVIDGKIGACIVRIEELEAKLTNYDSHLLADLRKTVDRVVRLEAALREIVHLDLSSTAESPQDIARRALEGVAVHTEEIGKTLGEHMSDRRALEGK